MSIAGKTYWLVGASEGLGRALAQELDRRGVLLVLSARNQDRLEELAGTLTQDAAVVPLDVSDVASVEAAVAALPEIDGVVYLAALYEPMHATDWQADQVEAMCDVNFMGAARVFGRIMPGFTKRDAGHVVTIGSLSGYRGLSGAIGYGASKSALMHLTETMRADLWRTNVRLSLINLGFIATRLTKKNDFKMPFQMTPDQAATRVADAMETRRFKTDIPWLFSLLFRVSRFMPDAVFLRIFGKG